MIALEKELLGLNCADEDLLWSHQRLANPLIMLARPE
jgi:hypothetical protein